MNFETKVQPTLKIQATGWFKDWDVKSEDERMDVYDEVI